MPKTWKYFERILALSSTRFFINVPYTFKLATVRYNYLDLIGT